MCSFFTSQPPSRRQLKSPGYHLCRSQGSLFLATSARFVWVLLSHFATNISGNGFLTSPPQMPQRGMSCDQSFHQSDMKVLAPLAPFLPFVERPVLRMAPELLLQLSIRRFPLQLKTISLLFGQMMGRSRPVGNFATT